MVIVRGKNVYTTSEVDKLMSDFNLKISALDKEVSWIKRELKRLSKPIDSKIEPISNAKKPTIGRRLLEFINPFARA